MAPSAIVSCSRGVRSWDGAVRIGRFEIGAGDRIRTGDIDLGKVALYQLSYSRARGGKDLKDRFIVAPAVRKVKYMVMRVVGPFE